MGVMIELEPYSYTIYKRINTISISTISSISSISKTPYITIHISPEKYMNEQEDNYRVRLRQLLHAGKIDLRALGAGLVHVDVLHGDSCPALQGGVCSCDPDLYMWKDGDPASRRKVE
jgi:hypothetical protein